MHLSSQRSLVDETETNQHVTSPVHSGVQLGSSGLSSKDLAKNCMASLVQDSSNIVQLKLDPPTAMLTSVAGGDGVSGRTRTKGDSSKEVFVIW